jgi:recombination associated protein RdgC
MWFKNLQVYRFPAPWKITARELEQQLSRQLFRSPSGFELQASGWAPPREHGPLVKTIHGQYLIALGTEKKLLPASVVKEVTKIKAQEAEESQGYKPGRKQMRDIKEQAIDELLPRAFNVRRDTRVWIDPANGWLVIDAGSPGKADEVMLLLNKCIDDFVAERLNTAQGPGAAMTGWLAADHAPSGFTIDDDAELQMPAEEKATVRFVRHALEPADVKRHIEAGKQCTRLGMTWMNRVSFVLTESLVIKRVAAVDVISENDDSPVESSPQDEDERFDADFTLMTGELRQMLDDLLEALGGQADIDAAAPTDKRREWAQAAD